MDQDNQWGIPTATETLPVCSCAADLWPDPSSTIVSGSTVLMCNDYTTTIAASPSPTPSQCALGGNPDPSCWNALGLTDYVNDWVANNDCSSFAGFADCWYSKETIYAPSTCAQLNALPACDQPKFADFDSAEKFYVSTSQLTSYPKDAIAL